MTPLAVSAPSFTQTILDALALDPAVAETALRAAGWTGRAGFWRSDAALGLPALTLQEGIAMERIHAWAKTDANPTGWLHRMRTGDALIEQAATYLQSLRDVLRALVSPACEACKGAGSMLCDVCGGEGEDDEDRCDACSGKGAHGCESCDGIRILSDTAVPVLELQAQIAKVRLDASEQRLREVESEVASRRDVHEQAAAALLHAVTAAVPAGAWA